MYFQIKNKEKMTEYEYYVNDDTIDHKVIFIYVTKTKYNEMIDNMKTGPNDKEQLFDEFTMYILKIFIYQN